MFCVWTKKSVNQWHTRDNFSFDLPIEQVKFEAKENIGENGGKTQ